MSSKKKQHGVNMKIDMDKYKELIKLHEKMDSLFVKFVNKITTKEKDKEHE